MSTPARRVLQAAIALILTASLLVVSPAAVAPAAAQTPPPAGEVAEAPGDGGGVDIALAYLNAHLDELGLSADDVDDLIVTDHYTTTSNGVTHVYLRQRHNGLEVVGANLNFNIAADGTVLSVGNRGITGIAKLAGEDPPGLSEVAAVRRAAARLGLPIRGPLRLEEPRPAPGAPGFVSNGGISTRPIRVQLVHQPLEDGTLRLAWSVQVDQLDGEHWWDIRVDATTGEELARNDFVTDNIHTSEAAAPARTSGAVGTAMAMLNFLPSGYNVYPAPLESPGHGGRSTVIDPEDPIASPFGWHDTDGVAGAEFTVTEGNNVNAYEDGNNPGFQPDGGASLTFDFPIDLTQHPDLYEPAAITNLFYWSNLVHDVLYHYGFDEPAGNFQENNYGNGGLGGDSVDAEAQDGSGNCNANFATPPDGSSPRMQMYTCNLGSPVRDGDLDNGVIVHEYGHGVSNRLTGGPSNVFCLSGAEQAGEGWSDYLSLIFTIEPGDAGTDARGIGTYLFGQPPNGPGIRAYPYSTNMAIDPRTYNEIKTASVPHGVGSTFAAMLWEVTWALIDVYGFDPDLISGTGGNNIALQLVMDGMKLQPCGPGFVDARDAILLADQVNYGGVNQCLIWEAFAKRGLGFSADQGSPSNRSDGTEAFDIPPACQLILKLFKSASPAVVVAGDELTYTLEVVNDTPGTLTDVTITDSVPAITTYVPGSADCGGSESGGVVTFPLGTMASGASQTCSFRVLVDTGFGTVVTFSDDMESGGAAWSATAGTGTDNWTLGTTNPHSPAHAWFADNVATITDQYLTMDSAVPLTGAPVLRFWHDFNTENTFDGGVVEISTDGGTTWSDLGAAMTSNGYRGTLSGSYGNPIGGRPAFTGDSNGYLLTEVDLAAYSGSSVQIRFRLGTDNTVSDEGWYIDDVEILEEKAVLNTACVTAFEGDSFCDSTFTEVLDPNVNHPPVANNDAYSMDEDTVLNVAALGVLDNDTDDNGDLLTAVLDTSTTDGSLTLYADGGFDYAPDQDFCGDDSFTYHANDGEADSNTATVTISVACLGDLEITKSASPVVFAGDELTFTLEVVNNTPVLLTDVTITDAVPAGTTYVAGSADCGGSESAGVVTFSVGDMAAGSSQTCSFSVLVDAGPGTVVSFADDMEAGGGAWTATAGVGSDNWMLGTTNPHSPDNAWFAADVATVTDQYLTMASAVSLTGAPELRFWHDYNTEPTFDGGVVEISTDGGATWSDLGTAMTGNGYNGTISTSFGSPIGGRQAFTGDSGGYILTEADLSAYAGSSIQIRFRLGTDNSFSDEGWYVDDVEIIDEVTVMNSACVSAAEGESDCDSSVTLVEPQPNAAPVANDEGETVDEDTVLNVPAPGVLDNDTDDDGDLLTAVLDSSTSNGSLNLDADGGFDYTPDADYCGTDSFTYLANDGQADSNTATVTIDVTCVNDPPVANDDNDTVTEDGNVVVPVLDNDTDIDGDTLVVTNVSDPPNGTAINNGDGTVTYEPDPDFCGPDSFTYQANDGQADSNTATVSIDVTCVNDAPTLTVDDNPVNVNEGALAGNTGTVGDVDGDTVSLTASIGTIINNNDGTWSWSYQTDGTTPDQMVVVNASDGNGGTASTSFELVVANLPPIGQADVTSQSVQYSDVIAPVSFTGTDVAGDIPLAASASWSSDGGSTFVALPTTLTLGGGTCVANGQVECGWTLSGIADVAAGNYVVRVSISDPQGESVDVDVDIEVLREDTRVTFDSANPVSVPVIEDGGNSETFWLSVEVREFDDPDDVAGDANRAGDIGLADVGLVLVPVGPGGNEVPSTCSESTTTGTTDPDGGSYEVLTVTCQFDSVPVNTYEASVQIGGDYYGGGAEDVLVVFDPSLGFTTGGGTYEHESGDRVNFGYTMKYNKKGTNVQGSLLVIRHTDDGIYRLKSNQIEGLALGSSDAGFTWASFSGKSTYKEPDWEDAVGNYQFVAYVEDHATPGDGEDRFWVTANRSGNLAVGLAMADPATDNAALLAGGNIVVPHQGGGGGRRPS